MFLVRCRIGIGKTCGFVITKHLPIAMAYFSWEKVGMGLPNLFIFNRASFAALLMTSLGDLQCFRAIVPVASVKIA